MSARLIPLFLALLFLTACSSLEPRPANDGEAAAKWKLRSERIALIRDWALSGRAVVKNGRKSWHFGVYWRTSPGGYSIELKTPLGQGVARLQSDATGAELRIPDEPTLRSDDARTLLARRFGWQLPTTLMNRWVLGLPALGTEEVPIVDDSGAAMEIREAGWDITYRRYAEWAGYRLPAMIVMNQGETEVKVVIDEWMVDG
ncbi:MAG: outer membrane lipoprotein LolB [Gammaproteobacteria bacterium]|nr:outer membrane lipoprotein LolB [Gammaproteobacteria bacterium]